MFFQGRHGRFSDRTDQDLVRRHSMSVVFEIARMEKGGISELPLKKIFGVTPIELV